MERLDKYKASAYIFIKDLRILFDNNQAEWNLSRRKYLATYGQRIKQRLKIMSYVGTAYKQEWNAYDAIKKTISGHPECILE